MSAQPSIYGSIVAIVTPMDADGSVNFERLNELVDWHIESGTHAIVAVGTTGESATLDLDEHLDVIRAVVKRSAGRVPVIAGTGSNATAEAIVQTRAAADMGADAALLVTPYYNKPPQEGLYQHFSAIARAVPQLPLILYNVPGRTGCDMLPATVARLAAAHANIAGLKEATGTLTRVRELLALGLPSGFGLYSGDDATARESILLGFHGDISVTANVAPALMAQMCNAAMSGNAELAGELDARLAGLHKQLFIEPNPIPAKWLLAEMGRIPAGIRLPLVPMAQEHGPALKIAAEAAGIL